MQKKGESSHDWNHENSTDGETEGQTDGRTDGQTDRQTRPILKDTVCVQKQQHIENNCIV